MFIRHPLWALFQSKYSQQLLAKYSKEIGLEVQKPALFIRLDMIMSMFLYGSIYSEYYVFQFYLRSKANRKSFFTTFFEYELNDQLNNPSYRDLFWDKTKFLTVFKEYIHREWCKIDDNEVQRLFSNHDSLVIKEKCGCSGSMVQIIDTKDYQNARALQLYMRSQGYNMIETMLVNHKELAQFNPRTLNTIRFVTVAHNGAVRYIVAALRVGGRNARVDNISQGGACAPINIDNGKIYGPFVAKSKAEKPVCDDAIGFAIPYWEEVKALVSKAALMIPEIRFVAWDIAITQQGPVIVEGNNSFGPDIMQMHYGINEQGLKPRLMAILKELGIDFL